MKTTTYRGVTITETKTTTDTTRYAFGKPYSVVANVYKLEGVVNKPAGQSPFITSIKAAREFIDLTLDLRG